MKFFTASTLPNKLWTFPRLLLYRCVHKAASCTTRLHWYTRIPEACFYLYALASGTLVTHMSLEKTNKYREAPKVTTLLFFLTLLPLIRRIFLALRFHTSFNENFTLEGLFTVNKVSPMGKNKQLQPVWFNSDSLFQLARKVIQRSKKLSMYSHDNFLMKEKNSKRRHLVGSYFRSWKRRWEKTGP